MQVLIIAVIHLLAPTLSVLLTDMDYFGLHPRWYNGSIFLQNSFFSLVLEDYNLPP